MEDMLMNMEERTEEATVDKEQAESTNTRTVKKYSDEDVDKIIQRKYAKWKEQDAKQQQKQEREDELDAREKKLRIRELKADAKERLSEDGYPAGLADFLSYASDDEFEESYKKVTRMMDEQRRAWEVAQEEKRATGRTPKSYSGNAGDPIKEAFRRQ